MQFKYEWLPLASTATPIIINGEVSKMRIAEIVALVTGVRHVIGRTIGKERLFLDNENLTEQIGVR
jgi:hypothetical protein